MRRSVYEQKQLIGTACRPAITISPRRGPSGAPSPHRPALTFHPLWLQLSATISPSRSAPLSSFLSYSFRTDLTLTHLTATAVPSESLKGTKAKSHNSCSDKAALGPQARCISPHCRSAFSCPHWRYGGSRETVVKESFIICLEKTTEQSFNQGRKDCSSPRIVTYLLAAAPWKCRFESPWGKRED